MINIIGTFKRLSLYIGISTLVICSAEAGILTDKSPDHRIGIGREAVVIPDATNGAPWTKSTGIIYELNQLEQIGTKIVLQPYLSGRAAVFYQLDPTLYDSNRGRYQYRTKFNVSVPLRISPSTILSSDSGTDWAKNGPEIQEFYFEVYSGFRLAGSPRNISGLRLGGQISFVQAEYEIDDEVGYDFGMAMRDQLNHQGTGGKYQIDGAYQFKNSRLSLELTRVRFRDEEWGGKFTRDQIKLSYFAKISNKTDCGINAIRTENDYNNNILGFDDIVVQVNASCRWAF